MSPRQNLLRGLSIILWPLLAACPAAADLIRFRDGTRMRGTVVKRAPNEIVVQFASGTVTFAPGEIVSVEPERADPQASAPIERPAEPQPTGRSDATPAAPAEPLPPAQGAAGERPADTTFLDAMRSVVFIVTQYGDESVGMGSGVVLNRRGIVITNYHVIEGAEQIEVFIPSEEAKISTQTGRPYQAHVLKTDPCYDLAVLRVPVSTPKYVRFARDEEIRVGVEVRAVGNPEGLTVSASKGIISAIRSLRDLGGADQFDWSESPCAHVSERVLDQFTFVQTDTAINPGNSGGPLLNERHDVVGINSYGVFSAQGLNFAVHAKHARALAGSYLKE